MLIKRNFPLVSFFQSLRGSELLLLSLIINSNFTFHHHFHPRDVITIQVRQTGSSRFSKTCGASFVIVGTTTPKVEIRPKQFILDRYKGGVVKSASYSFSHRRTVTE